MKIYVNKITTFQSMTGIMDDYIESCIDIDDYFHNLDIWI